MDEKAPKIDDKKFAAHMNKNKKPKTTNSTQKSLADIRKRADSIVRSKKSTAQMRNSAGLKRLGDAYENMDDKCCKNCGDMFGKPTKENKSCMYNAYNPKGKNWINAEKYHSEAVITPKMQKRALASPAAKAKPKSQVTLPKMPKLSIDKQKDEGNGLWANIRAKRARGERMRKKGEKGAPTQDQIKRAQGEAVSPAQQAAIAISKKERGEKPKDEGAMSRIASTGSTLKKPKGLDTFKKKPTNESFDFKVNIDGFPEMFMSGNSPSEVKTHLRKLVKQPSMIQSVDRVTKADKKKHHRDKVRESVEEGMKYTHAAVDMKGKVIGMASQESDAKDMARRNKGRVVKLKKPMSDKKGDMMINRPFKEGNMPDEGTPEARNKASKMTPGQEGVMDFLKNVGNTVMYGTQKSSKPAKKPRVNTNRGSTSGRTNSIASRINFGGKYGNK